MMQIKKKVLLVLVCTLFLTGIYLFAGNWTSIGNDSVYPTGSVGIGTDSPDYKLDVTGTQRIKGSLIISGDWQGILFAPNDITPGQTITGPRLTYNPTGKSLNIVSGYTTDGNRITFGIGNSVSWAAKMVIDPLGNVGIGTIEPAGKLDVVGNIIIRNKGDQNSVIEAEGWESSYRIAIQDGNGRVTHTWNALDTTGGSMAHVYESDNTTEGSNALQIGAGTFCFYTAPGGAKGSKINWRTGLYQDTKGNVGIGKTDPNYKLDINGSQQIKGSLIVSGDWQGLIFKPDNTEPNDITKGPRLIYNPGTKSLNIISGMQTEDSRIILGVGNSVSWGAKMIIDTNGYVGINTLTPVTNMHVNGSVKIGFSSVESPGIIRWNGNDFEGYTGTQWVSLTATQKASGNINLNGNWLTGDGTNEGVYVKANGSVIIGTPQTITQAGTSTDKLIVGGNVNVNGILKANRLKLSQTFPHPDYVFEDDYELQTLSSVEAYIKENKHLPEIPSAEQVYKEGLDIAYMNTQLLKKIEELTLHLIQMEKENKAQQQQITDLATQLKKIAQ